MLMKLNREATKEYQAKQQRKFEARAALPTTSGTEIVPPVRDIPNLFYSDEQFQGLDPDQYFDALFTSTDVKNLYLLFEAID